MCLVEIAPYHVTNVDQDLAERVAANNAGVVSSWHVERTTGAKLHAVVKVM